MKKAISRRLFLANTTVASTGIALLSSTSVLNALTIEASPFDGYNPYASKNADMRSNTLIGKHITVTGKVYDKNTLEVLPNTMVEVWHLSPNSTKYRHRAKLTTDNEGNYTFKTDIPNREQGKIPRINFKVSTKSQSQDTALFFNEFGAYISGEHWEKNKVLEDKLFPEKKERLDHSKITFNLSI